MFVLSIFVSSYERMVGVAGFKPTTSPTPRVRANQAALYSVKKSRAVLYQILLICLALRF